MKRMEPVRKPFGPKITGSYPSFKTASANPIDKTIQLALMARDIEQMEFSLETGGIHPVEINPGQYQTVGKYLLSCISLAA